MTDRLKILFECFHLCDDMTQFYMSKGAVTESFGSNACAMAIRDVIESENPEIMEERRTAQEKWGL